MAVVGFTEMLFCRKIAAQLEENTKDRHLITDTDEESSWTLQFAGDARIQDKTLKVNICNVFYLGKSSVA